MGEKSSVWWACLIGLAPRVAHWPRSAASAERGCEHRCRAHRQTDPFGALPSRILEILSGQQEMHLTQLLETLGTAGLTPHSTNPRGSVQTTLFALAREGIAVNHGRNNWALVKRRSSKAAASTR